MFPTKPQESYSQPSYKLQEVPLQTPGQQVRSARKKVEDEEDTTNE